MCENGSSGSIEKKAHWWKRKNSFQGMGVGPSKEDGIEGEIRECGDMRTSVLEDCDEQLLGPLCA